MDKFDINLFIKQTYYLLDVISQKLILYLS